MLPPRRTSHGRRPAAGSGLARILRWAFGLLVMLALLAYVGLPTLIRATVPRLLADHGVPAAIETVSVDFSTQHVTLFGLRIGTETGPSVRFAEVRMHVDPRALLERRLKIRDLRLREARFDLDTLSQLGGAVRVSSEGGWQLELEDLHIEALALVGASEKLGRAVSVERATVRNVAALGRDGADFDIEIDLGPGALHVGGRAWVADEGLSVSGKLGASEFPVSLLGPTSAASWSGAMHATLDYTVAHRPAAGSFEITLEGGARAGGLNIGLGAFSLRDSDLTWSGSASMHWPLLAPPERIEVHGDIDSMALHLRRDAPAGAFETSVDGFHWQGSFGWQEGVRADGTLSARTLSAGPVSGDSSALSIELRGLWADASVRGSSRYRVRDARASVLRAHWRTANRDIETSIESLQASQVSGEGARFELEGLRAAEATMLAGDEGASRWTVMKPELTMVSIELGQTVAAQRGHTPLIRGERGAETWQILDLVLDELVRDATGALRARAVAAKNLRQRDEAIDTRVKGLAAKHLEVRDGSIELGRLVTSQISRHVGSRLAWAASSLVAQPLQVGSDDTAEIGELAIDTFDLHPSDSGLWQGFGISASGFAIGVGGGGEADSIGVERLRVEEPDGGDWVVREAALRGARWQPGGSGEASALVAHDLEHRSADGDEWALVEISAEAPVLGAAGDLRVGRIAATRVSLAQADGAFEADDVESQGLSRPAGGEAVAVRLRMQALRYEARSGLRWQAAPVELQGPERAADGSLSADRLQTESLIVAPASGAQWRFDGARAAAFALDPSGRLAAHPLTVEQLSWEPDVGERAEARVIRVEQFHWQPGEWPSARRASAETLGGESADVSWSSADALIDGVTALPDGPLRVSGAWFGPGELVVDDRRIDWAGLLARDLSVHGSLRIEAASLAVERPAFTGTRGDRVASFKGRAESAFWEPHALGAESIRVESARVEFGIDADGSWVLPRWRAAGGSPVTIRIGLLETIEGDNQVSFFDHSIDPPSRFAFAPFQGAVHGLDTGDPDNAADFELRSRVAEFASLEASGRLIPRTGGFDVDARGRLTGLPLVELSGYAVRYLDTRIEGGHGDLDFEGSLTDGMLEGAGDLVLTQVDAVSTAQSEAGAGSEAHAQAGDDRGDAARIVSFAAALALLEDNEGTVRLRVPVRGPLAEPEFDFSDAAGQAIFRTAQTALGIPLQPVGLLLSARRIIGWLDLAPEEAIAFEPGVAQTSAEGLASLDMLAARLAEDPDERVAICGKAVPADIERLEGGGEAQGLLDGVGVEPSAGAWALAMDRADFARRYLTEKHGIAASRLMDCPAEVDAGANAVPRIEVMRVAEDG